MSVYGDSIRKKFALLEAWYYNGELAYFLAREQASLTFFREKAISLNTRISRAQVRELQTALKVENNDFEVFRGDAWWPVSNSDQLSDEPHRFRWVEYASTSVKEVRNVLEILLPDNLINKALKGLDTTMPKEDQAGELLEALVEGLRDVDGKLTGIANAMRLEKK